jgi:fumarylacetoacetate (FAA) hydrolase family protein
MGGAALVGRVLEMVSEPTHVVARTGQCVDIGRIASVGLRWDTRYGIWVGTGRTVVC